MENESNKFNKSTIFNNIFDYKNNLILRENRSKLGLKKNNLTLLTLWLRLVQGPLHLNIDM